MSEACRVVDVGDMRQAEQVAGAKNRPHRRVHQAVGKSESSRTLSERSHSAKDTDASGESRHRRLAMRAAE